MLSAYLFPQFLAGWSTSKNQTSKKRKVYVFAGALGRYPFYTVYKLDATCKQYGMTMNAKTKTMIVEKTPEKQCEVNVIGQRPTQVKQYKYLGTTVENTGQCKTEVAQRINQAKIAFWKKATILRSNISMKTRIRILMCYVFSVVPYGCETWTYSKAIDHKINAIEMWCYRRMLRIS